MSRLVIALGAVLVVVGGGLLYLTWLLFSRTFPRISKSGVFTLWMWAFVLTTILAIALIFVLSHS